MHSKAKQMETLVFAIEKDLFWDHARRQWLISQNTMNSPKGFQQRFFFFFFLLFRAAPKAYGSSQARCQIGATAGGYTTVHCNAGSLTHWARSGIKCVSSWIPVGSITTEPKWELQQSIFKSQTREGKSQGMWSAGTEFPDGKVTRQCHRGEQLSLGFRRPGGCVLMIVK